MVIRAAHLQGAQQFFWGNFLLDGKSSLFFRLKDFSQVNYLIQFGANRYLIYHCLIRRDSTKFASKRPFSQTHKKKERTKLAAPVYTVVLFDWYIQVITWTIVETVWLLYFHLNNFFFSIFAFHELYSILSSWSWKCEQQHGTKMFDEFFSEKLLKICVFFCQYPTFLRTSFSHRIFVECSTQLKHIFTCRDELQHFDGECSLFCRSAFRMCFRNLKFTPR